MSERELIGYTEHETGVEPLYAPPRVNIVTKAFIHCRYCHCAIYHCMGPQSNAVCLICHEIETEGK